MEVLLKIDEQTHDFNDVTFLFQKDPYPGDHTYRLTITQPSKKMKRLNKEFGVGTFDNLDKNSTFSAFDYLDYSIPKNENIRADYLINSISSLRISEELIEIQGICSTILR